MESESYRLETTFLADGRSVCHTTRHEGCPPTIEVWETADCISRGAHGVVHLQCGPLGHLRAVKSVREPATYMKEVTALSKVSDRDDLFVKFFGWYKDKNFLYIAMEYVVDGDLAGYIKARGDSLLPEGICKTIARQLLEGLQVLHERLICHRDLKPQNILVASLEPIQVKITDFGVSKYLKDTVCRTAVGTFGYIAPEVQGLWSPPKGRHTVLGTDLDLGAAGCIIHELLSLQRPFLRELEYPDMILTDKSSILDSGQVPAETDMAYLMAYCQGKLPLRLGELERSGVSMESKALVGALLKADPATRVKATEALEHPWLLRPEQHNDPPAQLPLPELPILQSRTICVQPWLQNGLAELGAPPEQLTTPTEYPHRARALYPFGGHWYPTYTNQLPFLMHEMLDIVDVSLSPAWWNARNHVGQRGWIPSSYLVVIDSQPSFRRVSDTGAVCKGSAYAGRRTGSCNPKFGGRPVSDKPYSLLSKLRDNAGSHSSPAFPCAECNQKFKQSRLLKTHILGAHWHKVNQIQPCAGDDAGNGEISDVTSPDLVLTPQMYALNMDALQNQSHQLPASHVKNISPDPAVYVNSDSTDIGPGPLVSWAFNFSYHASTTIAGTECGLIHDDDDEVMGDED